MFTKFAKKPFTAYDIAEEWNNQVHTLIGDIDTEKLFLKVDALLPEGYALVRNVDWWQKDAVADRSLLLKEAGPFLGIYWNTHKGTFQTAEYLWEHRNDLQKIAAIFVQAFMKTNSSRTIPDHWKDIWSLYLQFEDAFYKVPELHFTWDYRHRYHLPESLTINFRLSDVLAPQTMESLITVMALEAVFLLNNWQLVTFEPYKKEAPVI